ncbi:MAG: RNA-binding S4 domain-containing protein [Pseudomonadota bacterium]
MVSLLSLRIDKWLWAARFFKTRTLATDAVDAGKVTLDGGRIKPARTLKPGDILQINNGATEWEVVVVDLADVRGSAEQAQCLYRETEKSVARRVKTADERRFFREPGTTLKGRPTKRDRRLIDKSLGEVD